MPKRVAVDPVVLTMAVRYCLGRHSYAPGLIRDEVVPLIDDLGDQRSVMARDIAEWLNDDWHDHPCRDIWRDLLRRLEPDRIVESDPRPAGSAG